MRQKNALLLTLVAILFGSNHAIGEVVSFDITLGNTLRRLNPDGSAATTDLGLGMLAPSGVFGDLDFFSDGTLYFLGAPGGATGGLYSYTESDGVTAVFTGYGANQADNLAVAPDGTFAITLGNTVRLLNSDGSVATTDLGFGQIVPSGTWSDVDFADDGTLYFIGNNRLYSYTALDGVTEIISGYGFGANDNLAVAPDGTFAITLGNTVRLLNSDGTVATTDLAFGQIAPSGTWSDVDFTDDGTLYLTGNNRIYSYTSADGLAEISSGYGFGNMDNLAVFTESAASVPEPSSLIVLLGVAATRGIARTRRRRNPRQPS